MRAFVFLFAPMFAACQESGVTKFNANPDVVITSHVDGDIVQETEPVLLTGQVGDVDDGVDGLTITWTVDGEEPCPDSEPTADGSVSCEVVFAAGGGSVVLAASDPAGAGASATVNLVVQPTDAPIANLTEPNAGGTYYADQSIAFRGTVSDTEDAAADLTVVLETDELGDLGFDVEVTSEGDVEAFGLLPEGEHAVRLRVVDTDGKEGIDSKIVTVGPANTAPTCSITAPEDGAAGSEGEEVRFAGTAADADIAPDLLTASWESDKDGPLGDTVPTTSGEVGIAVSDLSVNTHRITLTVEDDVGARCTEAIYYTVGTAPIVNLTAPTEGDTVSANAGLAFSADVSDTEDAPTELQLSWAVDGEIFSEKGADSDGIAAFVQDVSAWDAGDHTVELTVTDTDGLYVSDSVTFTINAPPNAPTVVINPALAYTADDLFALATGSEDPDASGSVTYRYVWFADGIESTDVTGPDYPSERTLKDHTYRVDVFASDGLHESAAGTAEATIQNTAPTFTETTITPDAAPAGSTLVCAATADDADGDPVTLSYAWSDGTEGDTIVIGEDLMVGDTLTCTATADDGDAGITTDSAIATVTNTAPEMSSVRVTPTTGKVGDTLTCVAEATDDDGDTVGYDYTWSTGAAGDSYRITDDDNPGDTLTCTATATDTTGASDTGTASATVDNTDPEMTSVVVEPESGSVGTLLTCAATATDVDGGSPMLAYTWSTGSTGPTHVVAEADDPGTTITCTATATDADGGSVSAAANALVTNTLPTFASIRVTPTSAAVGEALTCEATATDADGGAPEITYAWSDGASGSSRVVTTATAPGDTLTCTATATDADGGTATETATATVENTGPVMGTVSITPEEPNNDATLSCSADVTDADGETPTVTYAWSTGATGAMIALTSAQRPGDEIICTATVTDAIGATDTGTARVTVTNRAPTAGAVSISPEEPTASDAVTCTTTGAADPDGEDVTLSYAWDINDSPAGTGTTLSSGYSKGDELTCTVTATDASGATGTATASVTVANTRPNVSDVVLTPSSLYTNDTVSAVATASDADGDTLTLTYAFSVNGDVVQDGSSSSLSGATHFDKGDAVSVVVAADDGTGFDTRTSASITVLNTPPTQPTVTIMEDEWSRSCDEGWTLTDDGNRCVRVFADTVDWFGALENCEDAGGTLATVQNEADNTTLYTLTNPLAAGAIWLGLSDQATEGEWQWTSASPYAFSNWLDLAPTVQPDGGTVENCVEMYTAGFDDAAWRGTWNDYDCAKSDYKTGYACEMAASTESLWCSIEAASIDADGDAISYTFAWDVDGAEFTDAATHTWAGDAIREDAIGDDELWTCEATPNDGEDDGDFAAASIRTEKPCSTAGDYAGFETGDACPLAHWDMQTLNGSGQVADLIEDVDLDIVGSPTPGVDGVSGNTYNINACSDFFLSARGFPEELRGASAKSISAWGYLGRTDGDGDGQSPMVSFGGGGGICNGNSFQVTYSTEDSTYGYPMLGTCNRDLRPSAAAWSTNRWYHMAGTYDGTTLRLFIDGDEVGSKPVDASTTNVFDHVGIGTDTWWSSTAHRLCDGRVDEIKLYDYALSSDQAHDLYDLHAGDIESCDRDGDIDCPAFSCLDILENGYSRGSGEYWLNPDGREAFLAYCDMDTDGGGWTLVGSWTSYGGYAMRDFTDGREVDRVRSSITSPDPHHGDGPAHYSEAVINTLFNNGRSEYLSLTGTYLDGGYILVRFQKDSKDPTYDAFHGVYHTWYMQENGFTAAYIANSFNGNPLPMGSVSWTPVAISARDLGDDWLNNYHYLPDDITDAHQWLFRENADDIPARDMAASSNVPSLLLVR